MSSKADIMEVLHTEAVLTNAMALESPEEAVEDMDLAESTQVVNYSLPNNKLKALVWSTSACLSKYEETSDGTPETAAAQLSLKSVTPMELTLLRKQGVPVAREVEILKNMMEKLPSISGAAAAAARDAAAPGGTSGSGAAAAGPSKSKQKQQKQKAKVQKIHQENQRYARLLTSIVGSCPEDFLSPEERTALRDLTQAAMTGKY